MKILKPRQGHHLAAEHDREAAQLVRLLGDEQPATFLRRGKATTASEFRCGRNTYRQPSIANAAR